MTRLTRPGRPRVRRETGTRADAPLSGRPAVEVPVDLLGPRNIYAVVLVTVAVLLTASAAGWSPRSSTPPGAVPTGGVLASTSSPSATPTPAPTTLTVSPQPMSMPRRPLTRRTGGRWQRGPLRRARRGRRDGERRGS